MAEQQNEKDIHYLAGEVEALTIICATLFDRLVSPYGASIAFEEVLNKAVKRSSSDRRHSPQSLAGLQDKLQDFVQHVQRIRNDGQ